jgi:diguanylate cyclase (GGDEF)-like protein/putative nucleotidyltransferase with HDIG domain
VLGGWRHRGLERGAWLLLAGGMACWTLGDVYYSAVLSGDPDPPYPSLGDAAYAAFYPFIYVGLVLLVRSRSTGLGRSVWLDGAIAATGVAALAAAALFEVVVAETKGSIAVVATNLVYPLGDVTLLALVVGVFALSGWRLDRRWLLIGAGLATSAVADATFLVQAATETYAEGTVLDAFWPASMLLLAQAAWVRQADRRFEVEGKPLLATPATCGLLAIGVLAYDRVEPISLLAVVLAIATLLLVLVRTGLTFRDNARLLERNRRDAVTDALTGMGNRRRLLRDLEDACAFGRRSLLMIFDLDGFKHYNDSFGHPSGDALLSRLGARLQTAVSGWASTYRLGGDEFCLLGQPEGDVESAIDAAARALAEEGEGFRVASSFGAVFLPAEASTPSTALAIADQRLYAQKREKQLARGRPHDVLLQALFEREPDLHRHTAVVAALAQAIGERLELDAEQLDRLAQAALLHDIGKIAVPDSILHKPGPLGRADWVFIERHTVIGQRILAASPALQEVGRVVRSSHERWDGAGYPDALRGDAIPLEARIVAACDAYGAMTSERPYRAALTHDQALAEIRRCAGTQFDPAVAEALCAVVSAPDGVALSG